MSSILFLGDLNIHTRSAQRLRALRALGHAVEGLSFQRVSSASPQGPRPSLLSRLAHHCQRPLDPERINQRLLEACGQRVFDLLWVEKAPMLHTRTLARLRQAAPGMQQVFFAEDDMFAAHNQSAWFIQSLASYDLVVTTKSFNAQPQELPALGARSVMYTHKTFDPQLHRPVPPLPGDREALGARVGFVGTYAPERAQDLLFLASRGIGIRIWGNGWRKAPSHALLQYEGRALLGPEYVRALCCTDINLGFLRKQNRDLHSDRSVEVPACGAFLLAERTSEHQALFSEGLEADYFSGREELLSKVHHWLRHGQARQNVAAAGRLRALESDYTHASMLTRILSRLDAQDLDQHVLRPYARAGRSLVPAA